MKKTSLHEALHKGKKGSKTSLPFDESTSTPIKKLIVEIPKEVHFQIDKMRLEMRRHSMKELVVEALNDLFVKYDYPPVG